MKTEQIIILVVAFFLGMLLLNMVKNVCGCDVVEGLSAKLVRDPRWSNVHPDFRACLSSDWGEDSLDCYKTYDELCTSKTFCEAQLSLPNDDWGGRRNACNPDPALLGEIQPGADQSGQQLTELILNQLTGGDQCPGVDDGGGGDGGNPCLAQTVQDLKNMHCTSLHTTVQELQGVINGLESVNCTLLPNTTCTQDNVDAATSATISRGCDDETLVRSTPCGETVALSPRTDYTCTNLALQPALDFVDNCTGVPTCTQKGTGECPSGQQCNTDGEPHCEDIPTIAGGPVPPAQTGIDSGNPCADFDVLSCAGGQTCDVNEQGVAYCANIDDNYYNNHWIIGVLPLPGETLKNTLRGLYEAKYQTINFPRPERDESLSAMFGEDGSQSYPALGISHDGKLESCMELNSLSNQPIEGVIDDLCIGGALSDCRPGQAMICVRNGDPRSPDFDTAYCPPLSTVIS